MKKLIQKVLNLNKKETIFVHLPAYREPELVPTIKDCLAQAKDPSRIVFGICRQFKPEDGFDNVDEYRNNKNFKIIDNNILLSFASSCIHL